MKAVVWHGIGDIRLDDMPKPALQWEGKSLAKAGTLSIIGVYPTKAFGDTYFGGRRRSQPPLPLDNKTAERHTLKTTLKITLSSSLRCLAAAAALSLPLGAAHAQGGARSGSVQVGSATIAYRVQGHGPAMMLVHGYPLSGELFAKNRAALSRRYTVVTPDLRGFGSSTTPDTKGGVALYAKDMLAVMDHLNVKKAIIGGMSMGGPVVLEMYREQPQRFRGMILIDTSAMPASLVEQGEWPGFANQATQKGVPSLVPILLPQMLTGLTRAARPALADFLSGIISQASLNGAVGGANALATRPDSTPTLPTIKVPTLVLVGLSDPIYGFESHLMIYRAIRGSVFFALPAAEHAAILERAAYANQVILYWAARSF